ncbi:addiction module antidote protein [Shinella oryzae]|uniref:Addiction module antidote protein n=1 Tax=Shinella oryzae TaxID=2871820 RepID=A0ABY9K0Q5_9HYPH|nr:addiction module antidote protein [Shinella oryzae]WLS01530.1 putative addiction module antidote protein [Shinella oryzae]
MVKKTIADLPAFDAAAHLDTPERQAAYIAAVLEDGDVAEIRDAIGTVARARGMAEIAAAANLNPKSIYRALGSSGNPEFSTIFKVLSAMGYTLTIKQDAA